MTDVPAGTDDEALDEPIDESEDDRRAQRPRNRLRRFFIDLLGRLHDWAEAGWAPQAVMTWNALQGSVVPGPSEALLVPLGIADPKQAGRLAIAAALGSTLGGIVAWLIGANAFEEVGRPLLHLMGVEDGTIARSEGLFDRHGWAIVAVSTLTPLPTKAVSMAAGAFGVPLLGFTVALAAGRSARFAIIALVLRFAGDRVEKWRARYVRPRRKRTPTAA